MSEEEHYSVRQIERMFDEQSSELKLHVTTALTPLTTQVMKTNGRLGVLEKMVWMAAGAVVILTPFTYWLASRLDRLDTELREEVQTAVNDAFDERINSLEVAE